MKVARYVGGGEVAIVQEPAPCLPEGGLLVRTEACGLCSGELMDWYMERKVPHVLGHEVAGIVVESDAPGFPVGTRVFPHHHAPCMACEQCAKGNYVHCAQWKRTKLLPGGMAEMFAVPPENLNDTLVVNGMRALDAALIEPLGCVLKSLRMGGAAFGVGRSGDRIDHSDLSHPPEQSNSTDQPTTDKPQTTSAVIGLGVMGLMHMLMLHGEPVGYDLNQDRIVWAGKLNMDARHPDEAEDAELVDAVFVCPGNKAALDLAISMINPGGTIVLFAPMPPGAETPVDLNALYFKDVKLVSSYSCGPPDILAAAQAIDAGFVRAEQVVSHFIEIDQLPQAYQSMKAGKILKPMVVFD